MTALPPCWAGSLPIGMGKPAAGAADRAHLAMTA
jgi:hypothetical protein